MPRVCETCQQAAPELRVDMQQGADGPVMDAVCETCYAKDAANRRAEAKRFGYRTKIVSWVKLMRIV